MKLDLIEPTRLSACIEIHNLRAEILHNGIAAGYRPSLTARVISATNHAGTPIPPGVILHAAGADQVRLLRRHVRDAQIADGPLAGLWGCIATSEALAPPPIRAVWLES